MVLPRQAHDIYIRVIFGCALAWCLSSRVCHLCSGEKVFDRDLRLLCITTCAALSGAPVTGYNPITQRLLLNYSKNYSKEEIGYALLTERFDSLRTMSVP